jgi:hypothetical protein
VDAPWVGLAGGTLGGRRVRTVSGSFLRVQ